MRQSVPDTIRGRVAELLAAQPDVKQHEFGRAIGRGASWVSAFLTGKRHANDVELLVKIARYFGVSVAYLLNEADRGRDARAATLLAIWEELGEKQRAAVLNLALTLRPEPPEHPGPDAARDAMSAAGSRNSSRVGEAPKRKRRG